MTGYNGSMSRHAYDSGDPEGKLKRNAPSWGYEFKVIKIHIHMLVFNTRTI